ncbi:MAG: hypothetical protein M3O88_09475 [Actinomycetota bacterium]|nr:hypothetical protein [Actinomycetota bacterium]
MRERRAIVLLGLLAGLTMLGPSALAKGPSQAVITGPGLSAPLSLREPGSKTIGQELANMVQLSGFFSEAFGGKARGHRPSGELGPRYMVTYTMSDINPPATLTQYIYPFADAGPVTTMARGQTFWGTQHTPGGWFGAKGKLKTFLMGLGVPEPVVHAPVAASSGGGSAGFPLGWLLAAVLASILATAVVVLLLRRRGIFPKRREVPTTERSETNG